MRTALLHKTFLASSAVAAASIVALASDNEVAPAGADATGFLVGVSSQDGDVDVGGSVDVATHGFESVRYGGTVSAGDPLTSDADGRAVTAAPAAGTQVSVVGYAVEDGEMGDIGSLRISPFTLTGV